MKRILLSSTFLLAIFAIGLCKAAAGPEESFYQALPNNWQQVEDLDLSNRQIRSVPSDLNFPQLQELYLSSNEIVEIPAIFNAPRLQLLELSANKIRSIPSGLNLLRLGYINERDREYPSHKLPELQESSYLIRSRKLNLVISTKKLSLTATNRNYPETLNSVS